MKYFLLLIAIFTASFSAERGEFVRAYEVQPIQQTVELKEVKPELKTSKFASIDDLITAVIYVESRGNDSAYCKKEEAVGCLQIRPIMLKECNRVLSLQKSNVRYELNDRWDRGKSIEIFKVIANYHSRNGSYEQIARFWNGGPNWINKRQTKKYWRKVKKRLKNENRSIRESEV